MGGKAKTEIFISFIEGAERAKRVRIISPINTTDIRANLKIGSFFNVKNGISPPKKSKRDMIFGALGKSISPANFKNSEKGKTAERKNKRATIEKSKENKILTAVCLLFSGFTPPFKRQGTNKNRGIATIKANKKAEKE